MIACIAFGFLCGVMVAFLAGKHYGKRGRHG